MSDAFRTTAIVLAGGRGSRLGGVDKAWLTWRGRPLIETTLTCLQPQVEQVLVVANAHATRYAALGVACVGDSREGQLGPMAGLEAGMQRCDTPWVLCVPVDAPHLPGDLTLKLHAVAARDGARACDAEGMQPLLALYRRDAVLASLIAALDRGERAMHRWQAGLALGTHDWSPARFGNLNTPADLLAGQDES